MSNLTVVIDDDLLRAARIKALQQGTSVNEICREANARFAAVEQPDGFMRQLRTLAAHNATKGAAPEKLPSRNELMDEAMDERMPTLMATLKKRR